LNADRNGKIARFPKHLREELDRQFGAVVFLGAVPDFCVVTRARLDYAGGMLWKKTWAPEAVLALLAGIVAAFLFGVLTGGLLQHEHVAGFTDPESVGNVLLTTLSFHGVAIVLGTFFLWSQQSSWREALGRTGWRHCLALSCVILMAVTPVLFGMKWVADFIWMRLFDHVEDEAAVTLILGSKLWLRCYLIFFAVILAPVAEEFVFRGLLFSTAKRYGYTWSGRVGVSLLFALVHFNAPTFLPLFVLALALTWLYEVTEGLLAPMIAHSLFNTGNLILLLLAEKYNLLGT
jgi:hypothetical protein